MMHKPLSELIKYLQRGTNLHIGILFLGGYGNEMLTLPNPQGHHVGEVCNDFKTQGFSGFRRCFRCRNLAIKKALREKKPFGGLCINNVYEYTHPVIINNDVACIICIGNILDKAALPMLETHISQWQISTMEKDFGAEECSTMATIIESYIRLLFDEYGYRSKISNSLIENVKNYIYSNCEYNIGISDIARFFHYNKQYLGRVFKKETGHTISEYINIVRLNKAKKLLKSSDETIISISNKVGFNNVTYFNKFFKKITGITPEAYRKMYV